ncbi:hypothetical protein CUS_5751 [Ruminococcus albus 8]|uniref:Uncharacterized protein n=1 Tax=Ruminococcus albus 8 TaxID=246199 RepID=E9SGS5_RUMAL|nr:hypothetical protein CUS_5751 [Ruminococcus albus 8]
MAACRYICGQHAVGSGQLCAVQLDVACALTEYQSQNTVRRCIEADAGSAFEFEALGQGLAIVGNRALRRGQVACDGEEAAGSAACSEVLNISCRRTAGAALRACRRSRACLGACRRCRSGACRRSRCRAAARRSCSRIGEARTYCLDRILIGLECRLKSSVYCIALVINGVIESPLEVAALYTTCVSLYSFNSSLRGLCSIAVHNAGSIEVVICRTALLCLYRGRNLFGLAACLVSVKFGGVLLISYIALSLVTCNGVVVGLDDTAVLAGECTACCNIRTLHGNEHRVLAVTEVVVFNESRATQCHTNAVLGVAVEVVVIDVYRASSDSGVTRVRVVIPVVMVCDIVIGSFRLHTLQVALSGIPEVVVRMCDVGGSLGIQCAVALSLVSIGTCIAVEHIAVVYPNVVILLLQTNVIALRAVAVHETEVSYFNVRGVLYNAAEAVECSICADTLDGQTAGNSINIQVAAGKTAWIGDVADETDTNRTALGIALQIGDDALYALERSRSTALVRQCNCYAVLSSVSYVYNCCVGLKCTVVVVSTRSRTVYECEARTVMCDGGYIYRSCLRSILLAADDRNYLQSVAACLKAQSVCTEAGSVLTDQHAVYLSAVCVYVIAGSTRNSLPLSVSALCVTCRSGNCYR